jgi:thiol-disulfide isomerase/thioredoxin
VLAWLAQLRVLQGAINTRLIMSEQAAGNFEGNALELLGTSLVGKGGKEVAVSSLQGKVVALYFSASWCGPCKAFTPALTSLYETLKAKVAPPPPLSFLLSLLGS